MAESNARARLKRFGPVKLRLSLEERFWTMVDKTEGCWNWTGALNNAGYGMISDRAGAAPGSSTAKRAHRLSYKMLKGPIPEGGHVLHSCDNRKCVNPAHLSIGTNEDNIADRVGKGRSYSKQQTHCKNGHEWATNAVPTADGYRFCRSCSNKRSNEYFHAKKG
ncbi:HNH endonuclease signature motif containing protein [Hymenobacter lapidarius]|uniref:HNH endonuclease signature motif containing protein n=1 Tax=Hymenobacter lapidarius TaxID=1908237 RepID=UPI000F7B8954